MWSKVVWDGGFTMVQQLSEIEAGPVPDRYARGWHCLGPEADFTDGEPHSVEAFGTKLVVFTDSHNEVQVLDAYCRHLGGDLSQGTVKDDTIACPFHDWRWDGRGRCTSVPYAKRVPRLARTRAWLTCRQNGLLFIWHDPEGNPPAAEVVIPRIDEIYSDAWTDWSWRRWVIENSHSREVVDNLADTAHFFYVHDGFPTSFKNVFEGHIARQYLTNRGRADTGLGPGFGDSILNSESAYHGPAYVVTYLHNNYNGYRTEAILVACHNPVTPDTFVLQSGVAVQKPVGLDEEMTDKLTALVADGVNAGFAQDIEIFKNKTRIDNPLLCDEDGPIYQLRRWYEQFYVDVADVTPDMTARFEFDLDTSFSAGVWTREVARNLAQQAATS